MGSREIKFRAFVKKDKAMVSDVRIGSSLNDCLKSDSVVFMQYTGLKDANGVEIYEGDIVECDEHYYYQVSWSEKHACWYASDCGGLDDLPSDVNVIGNIYQNPELLNG